MSARTRSVAAAAFVASAGLAAGQDRAAAVPGMEVLLENASVRVQYHDVRVGETVPMHTHPAYVAYVLAAAPPCRWPASLDAVAAAPGDHRVALENDRVRVLDVTVAPGQIQHVHAHCLASVSYVMWEGLFRDRGADGRVIKDVKEPPPASRFPEARWLPPQAPHANENLDPKPMRTLRVELKR